MHRQEFGGVQGAPSPPSPNPRPPPAVDSGAWALMPLGCRVQSSLPLPAWRSPGLRPIAESGHCARHLLQGEGTSGAQIWQHR